MDHNALPAELRAIVDYAVQAASADMSWKPPKAQLWDYIELKSWRQVLQNPDSILLAQLAAWDKTVAKERRKPCSKGAGLPEAFASAQASGKTITVDFKMAYDHYFGKGKGRKLNPQPGDVMRTAYGRLECSINQISGPRTGTFLFWIPMANKFI
jgi:hypothetical protein